MNILEVKKANSAERLGQLRHQLESTKELQDLEKLTVFVAGSYARNEASIHSDIDLFFVYDGLLANTQNPNIRSLRAFARVIEIADDLQFPAFSNDGEFLRILEAPEIKKELGGRNDDHLNYFTARMLMLLESVPVFGSNTYERILRDVVESYFRDYQHHPKDFRPIFLINDILRFWKTLCLNYENKRNQPEENSERKIRQKIKNFKLKFSRMLTCYGTIAAIAYLPTKSGPDEVLRVGKMSPFERLRDTSSKVPSTGSAFSSLEAEYLWFLEVTNVSEQDLIHRFHDQGFRNDAFNRAEVFGDSMYSIVCSIAEESGYLRYLVI
jgi:predicted nucleotidyltransferase